MCSWSEEYLTQVHIKLCTKRALALRTRQSPRRDGRVQAIPAESRQIRRRKRTSTAFFSDPEVVSCCAQNQIPGLAGQ